MPGEFPDQIQDPLCHMKQPNDSTQTGRHTVIGQLDQLENK